MLYDNCKRWTTTARDIGMWCDNIISVDRIRQVELIRYDTISRWVRQLDVMWYNNLRPRGTMVEESLFQMVQYDNPNSRWRSTTIIPPYAIQQVQTTRYDNPSSRQYSYIRPRQHTQYVNIRRQSTTTSHYTAYQLQVARQFQTYDDNLRASLPRFMTVHHDPSRGIQDLPAGCEWPTHDGPCDDDGPAKDVLMKLAAE